MRKIKLNHKVTKLNRKNLQVKKTQRYKLLLTLLLQFTWQEQKKKSKIKVEKVTAARSRFKETKEKFTVKNE